uniref:WH1 domain-containing protein n=1 Tax=Ursus maritimus TaxID=29073 RepID=A0A452UWW7_URSMA
LASSASISLSVRAVVMARDDSSGGWLPVGGGGLSQVSVCRGRGARPEGGARQGHYVIHGERLRDQKTTLECTLKPGLVYNKVNPIFHHWSLGDCKFGLTFQSPAEADEFQKSLLAALAALGRGEWCRRWALEDGVGGWEKLGPRELTVCLSPCPRLAYPLFLLLFLLPFPGHRRDSLPSDGESPGCSSAGRAGVYFYSPTILEHVLCIQHHATHWGHKSGPKRLVLT